MSQSSSPTWAPKWANPQAKLTEVVDFPTPPLPLATATTRFSPGTLFWLAHGLGAPAPGAEAGNVTSINTELSPGRARRACSEADLIWAASSGVPDVNWIWTVALPALTKTCLTS